MRLRELLQQIEYVRQKVGTSPIFICGGIPRDKLLNRIDQIVDLDITTGDASIHLLGKALASSIAVARYKSFSDGHAQVLISGFKVDFSSNFRVPGVKQMLQRAGMTSPTEMQCELYSRD